MPDIILPGRAQASPTRRRSQADPGLDVPDGAFGGGIGEGLETLGNTLSGISEDVRRAMERQRRLNDATEETKIRAGVLTQLRDGLTSRQSQATFADDAVRVEYNAFVHNSIVDAKQLFRETKGASRLSDGAMARLDGDLAFTGQVFRDRGDTLHLRGVERRGIEQLTALSDETASRVRSQVAVAPIGDAFMFLAGELDVFDETTAGFTGAFKQDQERDLLKAGRVAIIEATLTGLTELGRGAEAQVLLRHEEIAGHLDEVTSARLMKNTRALSLAHDRDLIERDKRQAAEEANKREVAALAFTTGFRPRMATGDATLAEIAGAETDGVLTAARAERLRTELADEQTRRKTIAERAGRVTSMLKTGDRLDPEDFDDHDDVAHHYAATLKPSLADLDPAQKATAIAGYVANTGIAPDAAINSLLALTATGEATNRIAAARELIKVFAIDATVPDKVPPSLTTHAELMVQLAEMGLNAPAEIVKAAEAVFGETTPGADQPNPALIQLAMAQNNAGVRTNGQRNNQPGAEGEELDDVEFDKDDLFLDDDDAAAQALIEEFGALRDTLADDGGDENGALVGSVDALKDAIGRRDPDEIIRLIDQLEEQITEERARLPENATPVQLASFDGIGTSFSPSAVDDGGLLGKLWKILGPALILLDMARRKFERDKPSDFPPTTEQKDDDNKKRFGTGTGGEQQEGSLKKLEQDARAEGQNIQKILGLSPLGDVEKIGDKIADIAAAKFQKTKKSKVVLTMSEIGEDANEQSAIQGFVNAHRMQRLTPNKNSIVSLNLGPVDPNLVSRIKVETGIDLTGLQDTIDTAQINHAYGGHGPGNEKQSDQVPLSSEAIATYRHVVRNFDRIVKVRRGKGSGVTLGFEKNINGVAVVVQQVRRGKEEFAFFTMFIKRRGN